MMAQQKAAMILSDRGNESNSLLIDQKKIKEKGGLPAHVRMNMLDIIMKLIGICEDSSVFGVILPVLQQMDTKFRELRTDI